MADQEIHSANIRLAGAQDSGQQIKIRDQNKQTYSFFKNKKDGEETEAFRSYRQYKIGDTVMIIFKEVPYKNSTIRNVMSFKQATGEPDASTQHTNAPPPGNQTMGQADTWPATAAAQWHAQAPSNGVYGQGSRNQGRPPASGKPGREYWERREARRESGIVLQVAFKAAVAIQAAKIRAGEKEDRDWLYNTTMEYYDWIESRIGQGGRQVSNTVPHALAEEIRSDDEMPF